MHISLFNPAKKEFPALTDLDLVPGYTQVMLMTK